MASGPRQVEGAAGSDDVVPASEMRLVLILSAVQFVNIVDFMMPSPLGVDFARDLHFPADELPQIVASYTLAASITGALGAFFLDRFKRRNALVVCLLGLAAGTALAGFAWDFPSLLMARVAAGAFGGPATSLAFAIISDGVPVKRRGRALGTMMTSFSVASVVGVPIGLELAQHATWHAPFFAIGGVALVAALLAFFYLPELRDPLAERGRHESPSEILLSVKRLLVDPTVLRSYAMTASANFAGFLLIPSISPFLQLNLAFPREQLPLMYAAGGTASFLLLRPFGRLVDRFGSFPVGTIGTLLNAIVVFVGFVAAPTLVPIPLFFVFFMSTTGMRNVAYNTLTTRVPRADVRARFQSLQSMIQHAAAGTSGLVAGALLDHGARGELVGMDRVALTSIACGLILPFLMYSVGSALQKRDQLADAARS